MSDGPFLAGLCAFVLFIGVGMVLAFCGQRDHQRRKHDTYRMCIDRHRPTECKELLP